MWHRWSFIFSQVVAAFVAKKTKKQKKKQKKKKKKMLYLGSKWCIWQQTFKYYSFDDKFWNTKACGNEHRKYYLSFKLQGKGYTFPASTFLDNNLIRWKIPIMNFSSKTMLTNFDVNQLFSAMLWSCFIYSWVILHNSFGNMEIWICVFGEPDAWKEINKETC